MNKTIKIQAVGDMMLGDMPNKVGCGVGSKIRNDITYNPLKNIQKELDADLIIGNLEGVIIEELNTNNILKDKFKIPKKALIYLKNSNIKFLNVANNHVLEHGEDNFNKMINILIQEGFYVVGSFLKPYEVVKIKDTTIGLTSVSLIEDTNYLPNTYIHNLEDLKKIIIELKNKVEIIVVSIHWGNEFSMLPSNEQKNIARVLIDLGVNIIIGHHSHTYQGFGKLNNGIVFYGLGNFISDMAFPLTQIGIVAEIKLKNNRIVNTSTIFTKIDSNFHTNVHKNFHIGKIFSISYKLNSKLYKLFIVYDFFVNMFKRPAWSTVQFIKLYFGKK